jgi:hypothetical protein
MAIGNDRCSWHQVGLAAPAAPPIVRTAVLLRDARRVTERLSALRRSIEADGVPTPLALRSAAAAMDRVVRHLAERHKAQCRQRRRTARLASR